MYEKRETQLNFENQLVYFKSSEDMQELNDESIDLIITSPPYNRGKRYSSDFNEIYNDKMKETDYYSFLSRVWKECHRVAKETAVFFLNIGDSASDQGKSEKVAKSMEKANWIRLQDIIWAKTILGKGQYTPSGGDRRLNNIWEHIYIFVKNRKKYQMNPKAIGIPYADKSNIGRYSNTDSRDAGNIWIINYKKTTSSVIKKGHDAPFPIELPYRCIKLVPETEFILDPFGGTCSTLAACLKLGKKGIAYEKYPRIKVIKERILEAKSFIEPKIDLIPHFELSLRILTKHLSRLFIIKPPIPASKKEFIELRILRDVLKNQGIQNRFSSDLEKIIRSKELYFSKNLNKKVNQKTLW